MLLRVLDGLTTLLQGCPSGQPVLLTEVRAETAQLGCGARVAEVLAAVNLLKDDTILAIRSWIEQRTAQLPEGFAADVRAWLLVLLDGDSRSRPRSAGTLYVYLGSVEPLLQSWAATRGHLREITVVDITAALDTLRGWPRSNAVTALRSLFGFATKRGVVFANPLSGWTIQAPTVACCLSPTPRSGRSNATSPHPPNGWLSSWPPFTARAAARSAV
jgi:hypothetical protein